MIDDVAVVGREVSEESRELAARRHKLEIFIDRVDGLMVIAPAGEIDIVTGGLFLEALIAAVSAGESRLIVDLGRVPFMDSTGLAIFVSVHRALRSVDGQLHVVAGPRIKEMFERSWMAKFFPLHASLDEAVLAFAQ